MAQGYTRNDTSNNINTGNIINAADLDGEFDALQGAFNATAGHTHDGTVGGGAPVTVVGPTQEVVVTTGAIRPSADNVIDLGTPLLEFKDLYLTGTANIDSLVADTADINGGTIDNATIATSNITVGAGKTLNVSAGTFTLANDQISGDKVEGGTINAITINTLTAPAVNATTVDTTNIEVSSIKAKDGTSSASIANTTGVMTVSSLVTPTADINGGTIDGAVIGASVPAAATFSTLTATGTATVAALNTSSANITGGSISGITDLAIAEGGTGASTAAGALLNFGLTATAAELNTLDGITASVAELNTLDGITSTVAELNVLDGITASTVELNYVDGVTSAIQAQLDSKAALASPALTGTPTSPTAAVGTNTTQVATTAFVNAEIANDAPTKTGGGASGTWGISISGNAATASTATSADQIDSIPFRNGNSTNGVSPDTVTDNGIGYANSVSLFGQIDGALYSQGHSTPWVHQVFGDYRTGQIALRGKNNGTWQSWRTVIDSSNYNNYAPTFTGNGASGTWNISVAGSAASASTAFALATGNSYQVASLGVGTAASGTAGEIRATNNITAYYSDDRLKTKLGPIEGALEKVLSLSGFYYEANEVAQAFGYEVKKEVGVSAQEVQAVMPEVVAPAPIDEKYLTVRYERLVPLLIEAIKEQQQQIQDLKLKLEI